jgi:hypothetical protein
MKKSIIEQLVDEKLLPRTCKSYFDRHCNEYGRFSMQEKVNTMAHIVRAKYDLHKLIKEYQADHKGKHTLDSLNSTLESYVSYINTGELTDGIIYRKLRDATTKEHVDALIEAIEQKVLPEFRF